MSIGFILPTIAKLVAEKRTNGRVPQIDGVPTSLPTAVGGLSSSAPATAAMPAQPATQTAPVDRRGILGMRDFASKYISDPTAIYGQWGTPFIDNDGNVLPPQEADRLRIQHLASSPANAQYVPGLMAVSDAKYRAEADVDKKNRVADELLAKLGDITSANVPPPDYVALGDVLDNNQKLAVAKHAMLSMMMGNRPEHVVQAVKDFMSTKAFEAKDRNDKAAGVYNKNVSQHNANVDAASSVAGRAGTDAQRAGEAATKASIAYQNAINQLSGNNLAYNKLDAQQVNKFNSELINADEDPEVKAAIYSRVMNIDPEAARVVWAKDLFANAKTEDIPLRTQLERDKLNESARWHSSLSSRGWAQLAINNAQLKVNQQLANSLAGYRQGQLDLGNKSLALKTISERIKTAKANIKSLALGAVANVEGLLRAESSTTGKQRTDLESAIAKQQGEITKLFYQGVFSPTAEAAMKRAQMAGKEGGPSMADLPSLYREAFNEWAPKDDGIDEEIIGESLPELRALRAAGSTDQDISGYHGVDAEISRLIEQDMAAQKGQNQTAIQRAESLLNTPYPPVGKNGQRVRTHGTLDCSELVQKVFNSMGKKVGSTTSEQVNQGKAVDLRDLQPGDVFYFALNSKKPVSHCAIFTGVKNGKIQLIHSGVAHGVSRITLPEEWERKIVSVRRF